MQYYIVLEDEPMVPIVVFSCISLPSDLKYKALFSVERASMLKDLFHDELISIISRYFCWINQVRVVLKFFLRADQMRLAALTMRTTPATPGTAQLEW